jgi:MYXO-CTERM domain-containing protein
MMSRKLSVLAFAVVAMVSMSAFAGTVLSDDFNGENGGAPTLNYTGFAKWDVTAGAVDLIGNGYYDFLPGNGLYIDMDGSTSQAGTMVSKQLPVGAGTYDLSFDLAGNQRGGIDDSVIVTAKVGGAAVYSEVFAFPYFQPFTKITRSFAVVDPGMLELSFAGTGGDNVGMLLDNVNVSTSAVPLPAAGWAGLALLGGIGALRLRRKLAA